MCGLLLRPPLQVSALPLGGKRHYLFAAVAFNVSLVSTPPSKPLIFLRNPSCKLVISNLRRHGFLPLDSQKMPLFRRSPAGRLVTFFRFPFSS